MSTQHIIYFFGLVLCTHLVHATETRCWLDSIDLTTMTCGWEYPRTNSAVGGQSLKIARQRIARGVGTHADSWFSLAIEGEALAFEALVGVDDEELIRGKGSVIFRVYADNHCVADSGIMRARERARPLRADLKGARVVTLHVSDAGDGDAHDHADWGEAVFIIKPGTRLNPLPTPPTEQMGILSPPPPLSPRINGARRFGVRPGHPLQVYIPVSGERPLTFVAQNLPLGISLDPNRGLLQGTLTTPGTYSIPLKVTNAKGVDQKNVILEVGDRIALTPPMGWNSWNCFAHTVSDAKIRRMARAMVSSGLIDHGWTYINIDDYWQICPGEKQDLTLMGPARDAHGNILPNKRFPDMRALTQTVHDLGLKIGLYSSPGPLTCGGCTGSWQHEAQDAKTFAEWGFDYLKYDWCSYASLVPNTSLKEWMRPYLLMGKALRQQSRDLVFSLCQYGEAHVSAWGAVAGGHLWRTSPDIVDSWQSVYKIADAQDGLEPFAQPGQWNDPDMLVIGTVGWGTPHLTRLTPNEQYSHVSLWCLLSAPLLIGCDLEKLDPFTKGLLTNDEVLAVNQDAKGEQAHRVQRDDAQEIWIKHMADGSLIAGIFNRGLLTAPVSLHVSKLGLSGTQQVRDLWRQQDLDPITESFTTTLPGHGVILLRLSSAN